MREREKSDRETIHNRGLVGGKEVMSPRRDNGLKTVDRNLGHLRTRSQGREENRLATLDREDELVNDSRHVHVGD